MENQNSTDSFQVNLDQFNGPLDLLLDLAKSQKVDLAEISITLLADQFLEYINKVKDINLDIASEYLVMATWLAYLKSKLLLPEDNNDDFVANEVAEKLKLQLKKLELMRLLSDQLLKKKRIGKDIFYRGMKGGILSIKSPSYSVTLYELLKAYSTINMQRSFQTINIPKLPVYTTDEGIKHLKNKIANIKDWKNLFDFLPNHLEKNNNQKISFLASLFSASLELCKEGMIEINQKRVFEKIFIKMKSFFYMIIKFFKLSPKQQLLLLPSSSFQIWDKIWNNQVIHNNCTCSNTIQSIKKSTMSW